MITASAPGKLVLFGEYAVMSGYDAWVMAVNRRVVVARGQGGSSPVLSAVTSAIAELYGEANVCTEASRLCVANSDALFHHGRKLGLGSSAAVSVAAAAFALAHGSVPWHVDDVLAIARLAHSRVQDGHGSGIDLEAAARGGSLRFVLSERGVASSTHHLPRQTAMVAFYTGRSLKTAPLIARVHAGRDTTFLSAVTELGAASHQALAASTPTALIEATRRAQAAVDALAAELREDLGGAVLSRVNQALGAFAAAKSCGAGGDTAVAFCHHRDVDVVIERLLAAGMHVVPLQMDVHGVRAEICQSGDVSP